MVHGMWDLPELGIEPMSLTLAGGFFTTETPGKPLKTLLKFLMMPSGQNLSPPSAYLSATKSKFALLIIHQAIKSTDYWNNDFILKAGRLRRQQTHVSK